MDVDDLARCPGLVVNRERLTEMEAGQGKGSITARLDRMEAENRLLRLRVDGLERQIRTLTRQDGQEVTYAPVDLPEYTPAPRASSTGEYTRPPRRDYPATFRSELPPGYIPLTNFAQQHRIPETTLKRAVESGRIPCHSAVAEGVPDGWKHIRNHVKWALDEEQQAIALERYGNAGI